MKTPQIPAPWSQHGSQPAEKRTMYQFCIVNPTRPGPHKKGIGITPFVAMTNAIGEKPAQLFTRNTRKEQRPDALTYWAKNGYFIAICEPIEI